MIYIRDLQNVEIFLGRYLWYFLYAILILSSVMYFFVFLINWEDWFFGIKLDGFPAGILLLVKAFLAAALVCLLVLYPRYRKSGVCLSALFYGFLFADSAATIRTTTYGHESFSPLFTVFFLIPVFLLILIIHSGRVMRSRGDLHPGITERDNYCSPGTVVQTLPVLKVFILFLFAVVILFFILPVLISQIFPMILPEIPFLSHIGTPADRNTVLIKVNASGEEDWRITLPGYALETVSLVSENGSDIFMYGTYWIPHKTDAMIRVVRFGQNGNLIWDMQADSRGIGSVKKESTGILFVDPGSVDVIVWLTDGRRIRLDAHGVITGEMDSLDTIPQPGFPVRISLPFDASAFPASSASVRILNRAGPASRFTVEDTRTRKDIQSIYSVNPTADGGYLISASVNS